MSPSPRDLQGRPVQEGKPPPADRATAQGPSDASARDELFSVGRGSVTSLSSMATRALLGDLVDAFAHATGRRVALESVGGVEAAKRVASGEVFDVVVLAREAIAKLTATGHLIAATQVDFVRSRVAAAIRAGTTRPTLDTVSAVQRALRAATSVGYSTGPSGTALAALFHAWGLTEALAGRTVIAPPGVPVATLVARGEVELGFQQLSELIDVPGVEILRELPPELEVVTTFSAAISVRSSAPDAARAWIDFLSSPAARTSMRRHGMEPA